MLYNSMKSLYNFISLNYRKHSYQLLNYILISIKHNCQQIRLRCVRSTNNEASVEQPVPFLREKWSLAGTMQLS